MLWSGSDRGALDLEADDPVAGALRSHWLEQVPWLGPCAVVADVGSGPAVLARMLAGRSAGALAGLHWICLDSADWPGARATALEARLTLRAGENFVDALPPPGGVEALLSNFGLEYVPREGAAEACWAWMAGGARLHAVMHARDSVIDRAAAVNLADIRFALRDAELFERAGPMLEALASAPVDPMERMLHGVEVRDAYNRAVNALKARMEAAGLRSAPLMDMLHGITALTGPARSGQLAAALQSLSQRRDHYAAECARLEAMHAAALDDLAVSDCLALYARAGLRDLAVRPVECPLGRVGWILEGRKP